MIIAGTSIRANDGLASTVRSAPIRLLSTTPATPAVARSRRAGAPAAFFAPHIRGARTQRGKDFIGIRKVSARAQPKRGYGFLAKVLQKITPTKPDGAAAAMRIATGPEKD